jgi:hypothetical protein
MIIPNHMAHGLGEMPAKPAKDIQTLQNHAQMEVGISPAGKPKPPYQTFGGKRK